jgi:hypothetical protein
MKKETDILGMPLGHKLFHSRLCMAVILSLPLFISTLPAQDLERIGMQPPVRLTSGFSIQSNYYSVSNIPYRRQPHNWSISGTPVLYLYGISVPFSFYVSNQQLGYQQPFNQFGISPSYKWATLHLGYSSVNFSEYTLAGRRFLGAGTELNPGNLRFGIVYGRFQKAVERDTLVQSTPQNYLSGTANAAFARKGYAVKLGYGTDRNNIELMYLHAADDTNSINQPLSIELLAPERNTAIGIKHRITVKGIFWESDGAISIYTRDVRAEPVDSSGLSSTVKSLHRLFDPRLTSQLLYAASTQAGYRGSNINTSVRYKRISRDFKTMGAYYFQTDIEEITLQAGTSMFRRRLQMRGNVGFQRNNLGNDRLHTTRRLIMSFHTGVQLHMNLRLDATYSNFGITQTPLQPGLSDSVRIDQVQQSVQISTNYRIPSNLPQVLSLQINVQDLAPRQSTLSNAIEMQAVNTSAAYSIIFPESQLTLSLSGQGIWQDQAHGSLRSVGGGVTATKPFMRGKLQSQAAVRIFSTTFQGLPGGSTLTFDAGVNYRITQYWTINTNLTVTSSEGSGQYPGQNFSETYVTVSSRINF